MPKQMNIEVYEEVLSEIEKNLSNIVTRKELSVAIGGLIGHRTFANMDALHRGVGVKIRINRTVGYPKVAVVEWLRKNLTVTNR